MSNAATINAKVDSAITYMDAGDYTSAQPLLMSAWAKLLATPDITTAEGDSLKYERDEIKSLLDAVQDLVAETRNTNLGIQRTLVEYINPTT